MGEGLALSIQIGDREYRGRLPLLPMRFKLWSAYDDCVDAARQLVPLTDEERGLLQGELEKQLDQRLRAELEAGVGEDRRAEIERVLEEGPELANVDHSISVLRGFELVDDVAHRIDYDFALIDDDDLVAVSVAAIGFCWDDEPLEVEVDQVDNGRPTRKTFLVPGQTGKLFRALDRDVVDFGEHVADALSARGIGDPRTLYRAGKACREAVVASIPRVAEVDEAADFSEARTDGSTEPTSSQG